MKFYKKIIFSKKSIMYIIQHIKYMWKEWNKLYVILNVILYQKGLDIGLGTDHIGDPVNIRRKGADDAHAGDVIAVLYHIFQRHVVAVAPQCFRYALRFLDPGGDMFDGIILVNHPELFVQDGQLGLHLPQRCLIDQHHLFIAVGVFAGNPYLHLLTPP